MSKNLRKFLKKRGYEIIQVTQNGVVVETFSL